jgi:hypothetical protein
MICDTNEAGIIKIVRLTDAFRVFGYSDVLGGSGSASNNHIGNVRFREMVKKYQGRYLSSCKSDKPLIALHIVLKLKGMSPPGRFLTKPGSASKGGVFVESDYWYEMGDEKAMRKVAQRLREKPLFSTASKRRHKHEVGTKTAEEGCGDTSERASPIPSCEKSTPDNEVKFDLDVAVPSATLARHDSLPVKYASYSKSSLSSDTAKGSADSNQVTGLLSLVCRTSASSGNLMSDIMKFAEQVDYPLPEVDHEEDLFEGCRFFHV